MVKLLDGMLLQENREAGFGLMVMPDGELQLHQNGILMHGFKDTATMAEINYEAERIQRENE